MVQLAIRCHPSIPADDRDLEEWLEHQVERIRADVPEGVVRLSRLNQRLPSREITIGWLIELELPESDLPAAEQQLDEALTDMRLLGFHPTLLAPVGALDPAKASSDWGW